MLRVKKDESGVVFITVTVIVMILMVLTVSIMSLNLSQATISEDEVTRVQAEMLAYGGLAYVIANQQQSPAPALGALPTENLGGHAFTVTPSLTGVGPLQDLTIDVTY